MEETLEQQFKRSDFGIIPRVTLNLDPGASIIAHLHAMLLKDPDITMKARVFNDRERNLPGVRKVWRFGAKAFGGQVITDQFQNSANETRSITFHSPHGGTVVWIDASQHGGSIVCQRKHFMVAVDPNVHLSLKRINTTFMRTYVTGGDQETILQKVQPSEKGDPHIFVGGDTLNYESRS